MRRNGIDSLIVLSSCSGDPEVVRFFIDDMLDFNPYRVQLTGWELFNAARDRFGDYRCIGIKYSIH
jgi:hypothetical protein